MQVKRGPTKQNMLKFPIYAIEVFKDFIYLAGGGGYEISNKIQVYRIPATNPKILTEPVHEEDTGSEVCNFLHAAKSRVPLMAACLT